MKKLAVTACIIVVCIGNSLSAQQVQKKLLILNNLAESLTAVDIATSRVSHTESNMYGIAPNNIVVYNGTGYIVNSVSHNISVINLNDYSVTSTISLPDGSNPWDIVWMYCKNPLMMSCGFTE